MDPNETLKQIREVIRDLRDGEMPSMHAADTLADLFEGLDDWLTKGGFLPDAWGLACVKVRQWGAPKKSID